MDCDATLPLITKKEEKTSEVFSFGEQTILKMQEQAFALDDFGTRIGTPAPMPESPAVAPAVQSAAPGDPLASIEQKLDIALRMLEQLQRRVDSLDSTIARLMAR